MIATKRIEAYLARVPFAAAIAYCAALIGLLTVATVELADIAEHHSNLAAAAEILSRLEGRTPQRSHAADLKDASAVSGTPFVEGATVTVAGAALLQRLAGAVTRVGGNILSSQVDLQGPLSKQGFVVATASCEVEQPALQKLLYDIEAGTPFLFIDELVVQAPTVTAATPAAAAGDAPGKLRVLISVSSQWQGAR
jgi:general secretion pathway protein M